MYILFIVLLYVYYLCTVLWVIFMFIVTKVFFLQPIHEPFLSVKLHLSLLLQQHHISASLSAIYLFYFSKISGHLNLILSTNIIKKHLFPSVIFNWSFYPIISVLESDIWIIGIFWISTNALCGYNSEHSINSFHFFVLLLLFRIRMLSYV